MLVPYRRYLSKKKEGRRAPPRTYKPGVLLHVYRTELEEARRLYSKGYRSAAESLMTAAKARAIGELTRRWGAPKILLERHALVEKVLRRVEFEVDPHQDGRDL